VRLATNLWSREHWSSTSNTPTPTTLDTLFNKVAGLYAPGRTNGVLEVLDQCSRDHKFVASLTSHARKSVPKDYSLNDNDMKAFNDANTACEEFHRISKVHQPVVDGYLEKKAIEVPAVRASFKFK